METCKAETVTEPGPLTVSCPRERATIQTDERERDPGGRVGGEWMALTPTSLSQWPSHFFHPSPPLIFTLWCVDLKVKHLNWRCTDLGFLQPVSDLWFCKPTSYAYHFIDTYSMQFNPSLIFWKYAGALSFFCNVDQYLCIFAPEAMSHCVKEVSRSHTNLQVSKISPLFQNKKKIIAGLTF